MTGGWRVTLINEFNLNSLNPFFHRLKIKMKINLDKCLYCGGCVGVCPQTALELQETVLNVNPKKCTECGICVRFCPVGALSLEGRKEAGSK